MMYLPKHFSSPLTIIPILVHKASASSIKCVVRTMLEYFFLVAIRDITFHINLLASGSIPVDGSSKNITLGFPNI